MKEKLIELIPEFNLIQNKGLREATLKVWEDALTEGEWKIKDLSFVPFTLLIENCEISFLQHTRGVTQTALEIAKVLQSVYGKKIKLNLDYLISGAILHDIGKLLEYKREGAQVVKSHSGNNLRHPFSGVGISFGKNIPDEVLHIIAYHSKEGDLGKRSPEAAIIHHADFSNFEVFKL